MKAYYGGKLICQAGIIASLDYSELRGNTTVLEAHCLSRIQTIASFKLVVCANAQTISHRAAVLVALDRDPGQVDAGGLQVPG